MDQAYKSRYGALARNLAIAWLADHCGLTLMVAERIYGETPVAEIGSTWYNFAERIEAVMEACPAAQIEAEQLRANRSPNSPARRRTQ